MATDSTSLLDAVGPALCGVLSLALVALAAAPAAAQVGTTYYVDADATGAGTGTSWTDAFTHLQDAIAPSASGAQIWIAEGVYYPDEGAGQSDNSRWSTFQLHNGVNLYGGFDPQAGIDDWAERDPATYVTVLSGDLAKNDTTDANGVVLDWEQIVGLDNAYHVVYIGYWWPEAAVTATLDGVTVTAGLNETGDALDDAGTGVFTCSGSNSTLRNVVIRGNAAVPYGAGGATYFWETTQTLEDVQIIGNSSCQGGGAYSRGGTSTYTRVTFTANDAQNRAGACTTAAVDGGGLYAVGAVTVQASLFTGNTASSGGGMSTYDPVTVTDTVFDGNTASYLGGGMDDGGCSALTDVTFRNNSGPSYGGGGLSFQCNGASNTYRRLTVTGNSGNQGGGIYATPSGRTLEILDSVIAGNSGSSGGGMFIYSGDLRLTNSIVSGNRAGSGGGILNQFAHATLTNATVAGNAPYGLSSGWSGAGAARSDIRNSIFWGNGSGAILNQDWEPGSGGTRDVMVASYSLLEGGCPPNAPALSAIGYREIGQYLQGKITLPEAVVEMKRLTRQFVRRQGNWFKTDDPQIAWFDAASITAAELETQIRSWTV